MSYQEFCDAVIDIIAKYGEGLSGIPVYDKDEGMYAMYISNGDVITGNSSSLKLTYKWASGHQAQFCLSDVA